MSWAISCIGKSAAVRKKVAEHQQTFSIPGEKEAYDAAKAAIEASLAATDPELGVLVEASGYATSADYSKKSATLKIDLRPISLVE